MSDATITVTFPELNPREAQSAIAELEVIAAQAGAMTKVLRLDQGAQDLGTGLALIFGAPATIY